MCKVWKGEFRTGPKTQRSVAIKQLNESAACHKDMFMRHCNKATLWEDGSLLDVMGCCLESDKELPALVTEWFPLGPLDVYLQNYGSTLETVDLVEAATSLAKALYHLNDMGLVHGELR